MPRLATAIAATALGLSAAFGALRADGGSRAFARSSAVIGALHASCTGSGMGGRDGGISDGDSRFGDGGFIDSGQGDGGRGCGPSQLITYRLTGELSLSGTTAGLGDGIWPLPGAAFRDGAIAPAQPPATVVLRLHHDGIHVDLVSLVLPHNVHQHTSALGLGTDVYSSVIHSVPWTECGAAWGVLAGTPPTLRWGACHAPATYGTKRYGEEDVARGPGCAAGWGDQGTIWCSGRACEWGGLKSGDNAVSRPPVWSQPLAPFEFGAVDLSTFSAGFFQVPTDQKKAISRIRLTSATEVSRVEEITPACVCP